MDIEVDINEAAAAAKKLASSTNTSTKQWSSLPYSFYSQVPPPSIDVAAATNSWFSDRQVEGATFSSFVSMPPQPLIQTAIPPQHQLRQSGSAGYNTGMGSHEVYNFGLPNPRGFSSNSNNYNNNNMQNYWNQNNNSRPQHPSLPVPVPPPVRGGIRFQLQSGKKHIFSKPKLLNPPLPPPPGATPLPPPPPLLAPPDVGFQPSTSTEKKFTGQGNQHFAQNNNRNGFNTKSSGDINYGLQNGSNWATPTIPVSGDRDQNRTASKNGEAVKPKQESQEWPDSLKEYSGKCYEMCIQVGLDTKVIDSIMTDKISKAFAKGDFTTRNWLLEPYPSQILTRLNNASLGGGGIPGIVSGKPIKNDELVGFSKIGRGGGRGKGFQLNARGNAMKGIRSARGFRGGIRGRNRFRSSRSSSSNSGNSSSSSSSSSSSRSRSGSKGKGKRKRRSSSSSRDRSERKKKKSSSKKKDSGRKSRKREGKANSRKSRDNMSEVLKPLPRIPHIYSEHGNQFVEHDKTKLNARAQRFQKKEMKKVTPLQTRQLRALKSRLGGFVDSGGMSPMWVIDKTPSDDMFNSLGGSSEMVWRDELSVVGTSTELEKQYLRLTSAPDASTIRPIHILKKSLTMVRKKWKENQDYFYACDQLKSIRQDCTVQRIRDQFTVLVYETHGRISLEKGDHEEFNQCQSQLSQLYKQFPDCENRIEFTAYRILYYIFTSNSLDMGSVLASLTDKDKEDECVKHSLQLQTAVASANYTKFFKLYLTAPKMSSYLIDWFANRERKRALKSIIRAYRPSLPLDFIQARLGLTSVEEWNQFLKNTDLESAIVYMDVPQNTRVNTKETTVLNLI